MTNLSELGRSGRWLWLAAVLVLVQACSQGSTREFVGPNHGATSPVLVRLSVVPRSAQLALGDSVRLVAYGQFLNGDSVVASVTWNSRAEAISDAGWYRAIKEGADTIRAVSKTQPALWDAATLDVVNPLDLAIVRLTPQAATVPSGNSIQFIARTTLPDGSEITPEVTWNSTGGTISPAGLFTATVEPGTYQVTAQITGRTRSGSTAVTVGPASLDNLLLNPSSVSMAAGEARQFAVAASWSNGSTTLPPLTWSATGGTMSPSGLYTAGQAAGTFRVIAASATGDRADTSAVSVSVPPPTLTRVILTPAAVTLAPGATGQFTVAGTWSDGSAAVPAVTYAATGGTITASGLYTAGAAPGSFRVIATQQGGTNADTSLVTIAAPAAILLQLVLSPSSLTLAPGGTGQFTVAGSWSDGSASVPAVTYSATGGTIIAGGMYTAGAMPGIFRVIATHQGGTKADTAAVTVSVPPPTLTQLVLTPASLALTPGGTGQFTVAGSWSDGSAALPAVTYSATGGTITASGLYTAGTPPGSFRVIATQQAGTKADTSIVTIAAPAAILLQLVLGPSSVTLAPGGTGQFTVAGSWSDGSATVPAVTYSATGGTITAGGLYTAGATPGSFTVIATHQGGNKADTSAATVSVPPPTLTQLVLNPASLTLAPGGTGQFTVAGSWSNGSAAVPAVTYSATGGTITAGGLYTAGATAGIFRVIAAHQSGTKADTSAVTVMSAGLVVDAGADQTIPLGALAVMNATVTSPGPGPLRMFWRKVSGPGSATFSHASFNSSFEDGTISEWLAADQNGQGGSQGGGTGPSVSQEQAHSGRYSWKGYNDPNLAPPDNYSAKLIRCRFDYPAAYYSAWYYWPSAYLVNGSGSSVNIMQFKERLNTNNETWIVTAVSSIDGSGLDDISLWDWRASVNLRNPDATKVRLPKDRWFNLTFYQTISWTDGELAIWLDGVQIFDLKGINTRGSAQNNDPVKTLCWGVGNYSPAGIGKYLFVDDAYVADAAVDPRNASVRFSALGTYVLRLTASDGQQTTSGDIHITVR